MTPWTAAHQTPLSMGFTRQKYWSGLPCLSPGDLPKPGIEPSYPTLQVFKTSKSIKCPYWENGDILSSNHCWCPAHNSSAFFFFLQVTCICMCTASSVSQYGVLWPGECAWLIHRAGLCCLIVSSQEQTSTNEERNLMNMVNNDPQFVQ